jgi:UDP-glucose 4-epimerase
MVLITGGAGFIGANLVRLLAPQGWRLRLLDNLSSGRAEDVAGLPVELVQGDIQDPQAIARAMAGCRLVVHLAAHTGVVESVQDPDTDMAINVRGTLNLLKAAVAAKVERFLFASTGGAIVGEATPPLHEDMPPRPISPYGAGKLAGEAYCSAFYGSYGLKTLSLRFSNAYGPYSYHKGSVIAKFMRKILAGEELVVFGDGQQTRDFVYVEDLCRAIAAAMTADAPFGQPVQLGGGRETSLNELLAGLRQVVDGHPFPPVRYAAARPGEVVRNYVSLKRAGQFLAYAPRIDLAEGLARTWQWFLSWER